MSLPLPRLDSREFDELVRAAVRAVPRRAPSWTDHNLHDPGITLIDLFSWLVEMDLYRLDRTPPPMLRTFLRLLGIESAPALAARTQLEISCTQAPLAFPAGLQLCSSDQSVVFETSGPLFVSPASITALVSIHSGEAHIVSGPRPFHPWGVSPEVDDSFVLRFDQPLALAPDTVSLYLWTGHGADDWTERQRLIDEHALMVAEAVSICPDGAAGVAPWQQHYGVSVAWEYLSTQGWQPLGDVVDETRALSLSGPVRFTAPIDHAIEAGSYPIRCRVVSGKFDCAPRIVRVGINVVEAMHAARIAEEETLGVSSGWAEQVFALAQSPVVPGSVKLRVEGTSGSEDWPEVRDWDRVGPHDKAFVLLRERNEVAFGNGRVGAVPASEASIFVSYAIGGGVVGNVTAGTITRGAANLHNELLVPGWTTLQPFVIVTQPELAFGGADAEALRDAQARAIDSLARPTRAVTLDDYEQIAAETPGVPIHRARALAEHMPSLPCVSAAGCITVVAVPRCPADRPAPTKAFLHAVRRHLKPRQLVAAELFVVAPSFVEVTVEATLVLEPNTRADDLAARALAALRAFLHPMQGGPDGSGWPVGRDVYRAEVLELLGALPCVAWVERLAMGLAGDAALRCGDLSVCPGDVVVSGAHRIDVVERRDLR